MRAQNIFLSPSEVRWMKSSIFPAPSSPPRRKKDVCWQTHHIAQWFSLPGIQGWRFSKAPITTLSIWHQSFTVITSQVHSVHWRTVEPRKKKQPYLKKSHHLSFCKPTGRGLVFWPAITGPLDVPRVVCAPALRVSWNELKISHILGQHEDSKINDVPFLHWKLKFSKYLRFLY